tara:strand:+ start:93 stop:287 length:195 start_codon:yes stop_codon:yes gene_type:complete
LKTVSLLKSELTKEKIKPKKLNTTKKNCRKVSDINFLSKIPEFLKFLIEKKTINKEKQNPKIKE